MANNLLLFIRCLSWTEGEPGLAGKVIYEQVDALYCKEPHDYDGGR